MSASGDIYLDYQATTPCDPRVVDAMLPWLSARPANPHSLHGFGRAAHAAVEIARASVAALVGAMADEVIFTSGATEATNIALRGVLGGRKAQAITSTIEHSCVRDTLAALKAHGTRVVEIPVSADGIVDVEAFAGALSKSTVIASVMAANNEVGTLQPISEIAGLCRAGDVIFHTDAAQAAGKIQLDVAQMNIDLLSISGHKIYGPQGVGALYCRRDLLPQLRPVTTGGGQEQGIRPGTVPVALCVGLGAACDIARTEMEDDRKHALRLRAVLLDTLSERLEHFQVNGSLDERLAGNLNIWFDGVDAEALLSHLPDVAMSMGSACSSASIAPSHVLVAMGLSSSEAESSVRIGFGRGISESAMRRGGERIAEEVLRLRTGGISTKVSGRPASKKQAVS